MEHLVPLSRVCHQLASVSLDGAFLERLVDMPIVDWLIGVLVEAGLYGELGPERMRFRSPFRCPHVLYGHVPEETAN